MRPVPVRAGLVHIEPVLSGRGFSPDTCQHHDRTGICRLRDFSSSRLVRVGAIPPRVHGMIMRVPITAYSL